MTVPQRGRETSLRRADGYWVGGFEAMASPCQVLVEGDDRQEAERILAIVATEVRRIEAKFSRYLSGNVIHRINGGGTGSRGR